MVFRSSENQPPLLPRLAVNFQFRVNNVNRQGSGAPVARLALLLSIALASQCAPAAFGQYGRTQGSVKYVPYTYNGQQYTIVTLGDQPAQVRLGMQPLLLISRGNVMAMPNVDPQTVANAQAALKAFQAGTPSGSGAAGGSSAGGSQPGLTVAGVVSMLNAGISEDIILEKIHQSGQTFNLSADDMVALKKAKGSDNLIKAMMEAGPASSPAAAAAASAPAATPAPAASSQTAAATTPAPSTAQQAPPPKKKGFFSSIGEGVKDAATGKSVIDKVGLRNVLPQLDPNKPVSEQFPHVAITVLNAPMGWTDPYATDASAQGRSIVSSCFKLQAVVWSDATTSKTVGPFDWCSNHDEFMSQLEPGYLLSLKPTFADLRSGYLTGINRTDGPAPPDKLLPNDRRTMDMWAKTSPQGRSVDLNTDQFSRFALMFANVRKDLGETLTSDGDARVWVVTIKKAAGPNILQ